MISNSGSDERGQYHGGKAGDQTGNEWRIRDWYNRPWNCVLRFDEPVRNEIAKLSEQAAANNHIGYDQWNRLSFIRELEKVGYDPTKITSDCEADCSSGVTACVIAAGYRLGIPQLKKINPSTYTGNMRGNFKNAGAEVLTDKKYLSSDKYLLRGDILLNDKKHCAINLSNGANVSEPKPTPAPVIPTYKPVTDEVVNKVIQGAYGNGDERKKKLESEGYKYDEVQKAVNDRLKSSTKPAPAPAKPVSKEFTVKVKVKYLRIRTSPKIADNNITGKYTGVGTFTIVEESNGWGKLKSGAGWISLDPKYVDRL